MGEQPSTRATEWLKQQGPWCPALQEYIERNAHTYDVLVFFTTRRAELERRFAQDRIVVRALSVTML